MKRTFYCLFTEAVQLPWYFSKLDTQLSHCFTVEHQVIGEYDCFMALEHLTNFIDTRTYLIPIDDIIERYRMDKDYRIIKISLDVDPLKRMNPFMHLNCASLVKKSLGINRPTVFTPKQLYKHLLSIGGEEI